MKNDAGWQETPALKVAFDTSVCAGLRGIVLRKDALFQDDEAATADIVLFGTDSIGYLTNSDMFRRFRHKSLCITETDIPSFFLPGLYAANMTSALTYRRTKTMPYVISLECNANEEVARLRDVNTPKQYLYSFMGGTNSWARRKILKYVPSVSDTIVESTDAYNHWCAERKDAEQAAKRRYAQVMAASKFVLCPRGCGLSSYRLFEAMSLGIAPVIISDRWRPIDHIDWRFAIFVPERRIKDIDAIVRAHQDEWQERGRAARAVYETFFARESAPALLHRQLFDLSMEISRRREAVMASSARARFAYLQFYWAGYAVAKRITLLAFRLGDIPFPFALHGQRLRQDRTPGAG